MSFYISAMSSKSDMLAVSISVNGDIVDETVSAGAQPQRLNVQVAFAPSGGTIEPTWGGTGQYFPIEVDIRPTLDNCMIERGLMPTMIFPKTYAVIAALSTAFLVGGILLSSFMVAASGVGLLATIGTALWEIRKRKR